VFEVNNILFLLALIPLLVLPLTHANADVTPQQHKCIQDKLNLASGRIGLGILLSGSDASTEASQQIRNLTGDIEGCLK
jgi:hypothetical protein